MSGVVEPSLPEGYKKTEVGVIPGNWECKLLGDFGDIVRGGSPRPAGDPKYFNGDYISWLTVASLTKIPSCQLYVNSTAAMLTKLGSLQSRTLDAGTLIISNSGATLGVAKILGIRCCANDGVAAIINQRSGNKEFLVQYINTKTKELHDEVATGNGQPNLNTELIRNIPVPCPPENEQTAIANALSDVDTLITSLEKLIAKKRAIKTAAMQQLLTGKKRLPPFDQAHTGYKQTELGEIPEDWEVYCLSDIAAPKNARVNPKVTGGGDFCIELEHVDQGRGKISGNTFTTSDSSLKNIFIKDDVLFGKLRSYLRKYWLADRDGVCSTEIWVLEAKELRAIPKFIYQTVQTENFIDCTSESYGTHMPRSDWKVVKTFLVATPSVEEQAAITNVLSDMDKEVSTIEKRLNKTQQLKQGMMQELLTGRTRLV